MAGEDAVTIPRSVLNKVVWLAGCAEFNLLRGSNPVGAYLEVRDIHELLKPYQVNNPATPPETQPKDS
jgi:hypothetical protein